MYRATTTTATTAGDRLNKPQLFSVTTEWSIRHTSAIHRFIQYAHANVPAMQRDGEEACAEASGTMHANVCAGTETETQVNKIEFYLRT